MKLEAPRTSRLIRSGCAVAAFAITFGIVYLIDALATHYPADDIARLGQKPVVVAKR